MTRNRRPFFLPSTATVPGGDDAIADQPGQQLGEFGIDRLRDRHEVAVGGFGICVAGPQVGARERSDNGPVNAVELGGDLVHGPGRLKGVRDPLPGMWSPAAGVMLSGFPWGGSISQWRSAGGRGLFRSRGRPVLVG